MIKAIIFGIAGLIILGLMLLVATAVYSHFKSPAIGLKDGMLLPCPESPNCVCSEAYAGKQPVHTLSPVSFTPGEADRLWSLLKEAVVREGGSVVTEQADYLHAEFMTPLLRFVDDFEMRMDRQAGLIHLRSASRVGRSDLGANRQRIERIWSTLGAEH